MVHFNDTAGIVAVASTWFETTSCASLAVQADAEEPVARVALTAIDERRLYRAFERRLIADRVIFDHVVPDEFGHRRHHGHDHFAAGMGNCFIRVGSNVVPYRCSHTEGTIVDGPIIERLGRDGKTRGLINGCDKCHGQLPILGRCLTNLANNGAREISEREIDAMCFETVGSNFRNGTVLLVKVIEPYFHARPQPAIVYGDRNDSTRAFLQFTNDEFLLRC
jgi:hypothetical protein